MKKSKQKTLLFFGKAVFAITFLFISQSTYAGCAPAGCAVKLPSGNTVSINTSITVAPDDLVGLGRKVLSGFIHVFRTSDNVEVETINVNDFFSAGTVTSGTFSFSLSSPLENCTTYQVVVDANTFQSVCSSGGMMGQVSWNFTTSLPFAINTNVTGDIEIDCGNNTLDLTCLLNGQGSYKWFVNNSLISEDQTLPIGWGWENGVYHVTYTENGCSGISDPINLTINYPSSTLTETAIDSYTLNGETYTQSGTYTQVIPNAAGCDSTITLNLSLDFTSLNELQTGFTIAPNPTMDFVTITSTDALYAEYVLFDPQGRKVLSGTLTGTTTQLDLSRLARGNYLLQIGEKGTPIKLVKE